VAKFTEKISRLVNEQIGFSENIRGPWDNCGIKPADDHTLLVFSIT
jgi:hypothetical protein